jgi:hypothetical protein
LPTAPEGRTATPADARVCLYGLPKVGKTTLAASWSPADTLLLDCEGGTRLLPGEHFKRPVHTWADFEGYVALLAAGGHPFRTVVIDTVDRLYEAADRSVAERNGMSAAALMDYGKGTADTDARFKSTMARLLALPIGVWLISHAERIEDDGRTKLEPAVSKRVRQYVLGQVDYVLCAERVGSRSELRTQPTSRYQAGSRVPLPDPMALDARALYDAIRDGMRREAPKPKPDPEPTPDSTEATPA